MEWNDLITKIVIGTVTFLGGSLLSLATTYVLLSKEISYIKGQLTYLLKFHEKLSKLYERQVILDKDITKIGMDLNQAHAKIRDLQKVSNL